MKRKRKDKRKRKRKTKEKRKGKGKRKNRLLLYKALLSSLGSRISSGKVCCNCEP